MGRSAVACCAVTQPGSTTPGTLLLDPRRTFSDEKPGSYASKEERSPRLSTGLAKQSSKDSKDTWGKQNTKDSLASGGRRNNRRSRREDRSPDAGRAMPPSTSEMPESPEGGHRLQGAVMQPASERAMMPPASEMPSQSQQQQAGGGETVAEGSAVEPPSSVRRPSKRLSKRSKDCDPATSQTSTARMTSPRAPLNLVPPRLSGRTAVEAPIAMAEEDEDGNPLVDISTFVKFTPLPYCPLAADAGDDPRQRSFVFQGALFEIPFLPLSKEAVSARGRPSATSVKALTQSAAGPPERPSKGWTAVKSKLDRVAHAGASNTRPGGQGASPNSVD